MDHATAQVTATPVTTVVEQLVDGLGEAKLELPLLPTTAVRVFEAAQNADSDAQDIARLVQSEQKLAVEVMKIANSAAYCVRNPIVTLQQAVTRLGMSTVAEIAFAASFRSAVYDCGAYADLMDGYWRLSLTTAMWAKEVARLNRKNVETYYLCGLFHNVCHPLALKLIDDHARDCGAPVPPEDMGPAVEELANHLAPLVQRQWQLPTPIASVLENTGSRYGDAEDCSEEACGTWAAHLLAEHSIDRDLVDQQQLLDSEVFHALNIYPDELTDLLAKSDQITESVNAF